MVYDLSVHPWPVTGVQDAIITIYQENTISSCFTYVNVFMIDAQILRLVNISPTSATPQDSITCCTCWTRSLPTCAPKTCVPLRYTHVPLRYHVLHVLVCDPVPPHMWGFSEASKTSWIRMLGTKLLDGKKSLVTGEISKPWWNHSSMASREYVHPSEATTGFTSCSCT